MSESNVSKTAQEQQKSSNQNAIGPEIDTLKKKFNEGSIPLQTDFKELIDIADIGRKAVGLAPNQKGSLKGMSLDENGILQLKIDKDYKSENNSPLKLDKDVFVVGLGNGITTDTNGIAVDPKTVLPRGMIVMFSGRDVPEGWAFCDGEEHNGIKVPDLRNRFIACGNIINETGGKSPNELSGEKDKKTYRVTTNEVKTGVTVTVNDTALTEEQLPKHSHYDGMRYHSDKGNLYGYSKEPMPLDSGIAGILGHQHSEGYRINNNSEPVIIKSRDDIYKFHTSSVGSAKGHNHEAPVNEKEHSHNVDITPPYYLLAFIMKL